LEIARPEKGGVEGLWVRAVTVSPSSGIKTKNKKKNQNKKKQNKKKKKKKKKKNTTKKKKKKNPQKKNKTVMIVGTQWKKYRVKNKEKEIKVGIQTKAKRTPSGGKCSINVRPTFKKLGVAGRQQPDCQGSNEHWTETKVIRRKRWGQKKRLKRKDGQRAFCGDRKGTGGNQSRGKTSKVDTTGRGNAADMEVKRTQSPMGGGKGKNEIGGK